MEPFEEDLDRTATRPAASISEASMSMPSGSGLGEGVRVFLDGIRFLRREPSLWALSAVPIFFAVVFVSVAISMFAVRFDWIHESLVALLPVLELGQWWSWIWVGPGRVLFWLMGWLGVLLAFAISLVAALLLANLASAPFLDRLSERVEALVRGVAGADGASGFSGLVSSTLRSFAAELRRLGFLGGIWVSLSFLGLVIPGAQLVTGPLLLATTIVFLPLDYAGFALDRRAVSFRVRRQWLRANLATMVGFGAIAFGACLVPVLNLVVMPALVTAGTLLVLRREPLGEGGSPGR